MTIIETGYIDIVFDGPPSHESGRFVEVEDAQGASICAGEWIERSDGFWALRFPDFRYVDTQQEMIADLQASLTHVVAERDALKAEHGQLSVILAQFQDFVARERALRDAVGKGGQQVNGYAPSITPSVLKELERMIRDAPDVAANYARLEAENAQLHAERRRDALDGQAALDEANNEVVRMRHEVERRLIERNTALDYNVGLAARHEQDIDGAVRWASAETCSVAGYATPMLGVEAKVLARFRASRKGGSE